MLLPDCRWCKPIKRRSWLCIRRIIRRAVRHGNKLGATGTFFYKMLQPLIDVMGAAYPELAAQQARIEAQLLKEEEQFAKTFEQGLKLLEGELAQLKGSVIPAKLYLNFMILTASQLT